MKILAEVSKNAADVADISQEDNDNTWRLISRRALYCAFISIFNQILTLPHF